MTRQSRDGGRRVCTEDESDILVQEVDDVRLEPRRYLLALTGGGLGGWLVEGEEIHINRVVRLGPDVGEGI